MRKVRFKSGKKVNNLQHKIKLRINICDNHRNLLIKIDGKIIALSC